jgi:hypothetical protein
MEDEPMPDPVADDLVDAIARWAVARQGENFDTLPAKHLQAYWRGHARALISRMGGECGVLAFCRAVLAIRPG